MAAALGIVERAKQGMRERERERERVPCDHIAHGLKGPHVQPIRIRRVALRTMGWHQDMK